MSTTQPTQATAAGQRGVVDAARREELAGLLAELSAALDEHMEAEEDHILPLAARTVSEAEWDAIGAEASSHHEKDILPLLLGMIRYEGDPEVIAEMLAKAPRIIRLLAPALSDRAFASTRSPSTAPPRGRGSVCATEGEPAVGWRA